MTSTNDTCPGETVSMGTLVCRLPKGHDGNHSTLGAGVLIRATATGTLRGKPAHHPDCPRGQHCWCPAGLLVPGYADSADGHADAADQARWDTQ